jgi:Glucosidase II beta subunit-like protein
MYWARALLRVPMFAVSTQYTTFTGAACPAASHWCMMPWASPSCSLGSFQQFEGDYRAMAFENGAGCWQGPARSIKVICSASAMHATKRHAICSVAAAAQQQLCLSTATAALRQSQLPGVPCEPAVRLHVWTPTDCPIENQVQLSCGAKESLSAISEPSRCVYAAKLATPSLCTKALQVQRLRADASPVQGLLWRAILYLVRHYMMCLGTAGPCRPCRWQRAHVCLVVMTERASLWLQDQWQAEADAAQAELDSIGKDEL